MSRCICPKVSRKEYSELEKMWVGDKTWDLLKLQDMYHAGNSIEDIIKVVPFRNDECTRTTRCCGVCTRKCHSRCIQDCLNRLSMWRKFAASTPQENVPLAIRLIVTQDFETLYDLSWCVGEIISQNTNAKLHKYMSEHEMYPAENPYKLDYSIQYDYDPATGKRRVEPMTGRIKLLDWPQSGLCPFCLPNVTLDRRWYGSGYSKYAKHDLEAVRRVAEVGRARQEDA